MSSQFDMRRPWPLFVVLALHVAFFFVLQAALSHRSIEKPILREVVVAFIVPEPPKPQAKIEPPKPLPAKRQVLQPSAPLPNVVPPLVDTAPSEAAITVVAVAELPPAPVLSAPTPVEPAPVTPPRFDAAYLNNPAPAYPTLARRMRQQGKVIVRVHVNAEGRAEDVQLKASCGFPRLDEVALDAVKQWRFVPARQGDRAVAAWVLVPLVFKLEG